MTHVLVIGGGPAGLMAADVLSAKGQSVVVAEAKPTVARKFLMAGKSGLNLTKDEPFEAFLSAYAEASDFLKPMLKAFGPAEAVAWAESLGQEMFAGSTGRVFPKVMKASPLLRQWLTRLERQGVEIKTRHKWVGLDDGYVFETPEGTVTFQPNCVILACGGASWSRLGSDGTWAGVAHLDVAPFQPANMGYCVDWSPYMEKHFGKPVKGTALKVGDQISRGEFVVSKRGVEGGGIYAISRILRDGAPLTLDLLPDLSVDDIRRRLAKPRGKSSLTNHLRKTLGLDPVKQALMMEFVHPLPEDLAPLLKDVPVRLGDARPMDEAISTAGGVRLSDLTTELMLKDRPGVFAVGEMLDWEAPTGGYLLTACLATGRWAGTSASDWLQT